MGIADILVSDEQILFQNTPVVFFKKIPGQTDHYFTAKEIIVKKNGCGWTFKILSINYPDIVGMMISANSLEVMIDILPLDLYKSKKYYYSPTKELERILNLNPDDINKIESPMVCMVDKDRAFTWSCPNECIISSFVHQYQWHINFEVITRTNEVTFFLDLSTNAIINLQRYPHKTQDVLINETTSLKTMQTALLQGSKPRNHTNNPHTLIREARQIQLELKKRNLNSIIIGSLARRLNSISVDVNDIDLMLCNKDQMHVAINTLESIADRVSSYSSHVKFQHEDYIIDLCYDNYNILPGTNYVINRHGLSYLGTEGLLWLYMINLFACETDEHSDDYKDRVNNAIVSIYKTHKFGEFDLIPYEGNLPDYSKTCFDLCELLSEAQMEYRDIRVNKPFVVRPFRKGDEFFYVIVNLGSRCDAELIIDQIPQTATWQDIAGDRRVITPIAHQTFSVVHIPQISVPGVLQCQRLQ